MHRSAAAAFVGSLAVALVGGVSCTSFAPSPVDRAAVPPPPPLRAEDWPSRDVERVRALAEGTPLVIPRYELDGSRTPAEMHQEDLAAAQSPAARLRFQDIVGQGVLRVFDRGPRVAVGRVGSTVASARPVEPTPAAQPVAAHATADPAAPEQEQLSLDELWGLHRVHARFVSSWHLDHPLREQQQAQASAAQRSGNMLLTQYRPGLRTASPSLIEALSDGVAISLPPPPMPGVQQPRGLVVHLNGLYSGEYERPLLDTFESRGWAIIHVSTVAAARRERTPVRVTTDVEAREAAVEIARGIDEALAENAYAVEAALNYCAAHRPDLPTRPVILLGCSTGALATPAVAARLGDRVDAAILVGGGANLLDILQRSEVPEGRIRLDWGPSGVNMERYTDLLVQYLAHTRLDPYHSARYLLDKPVLVVHAVFDRVVPASAGRLLYERLESPDRLRFSGGHTAMFYFMENNAPSIATWLDKVLLDRARAARGIDVRARPVAVEAPPPAAAPAPETARQGKPSRPAPIMPRAWRDRDRQEPE